MSSAAAPELLQCLSLLRSCRSPAHLRQAHAHAAKRGLEGDPLVAGKLLFLAAVAFPDALDHGVGLFSSFPSPDGFMHNTLIRGLSESPDPRRALLAYADMNRSSIAPDSFTFAFALKGAANYRSLGAGRQLHSHAVLHGFVSHLIVATTLVSMYGECGCLEYARKVFDGILQPNTTTWNAALTAYFRSDDVRSMEEVFGRMPWPNLTSWNVMLAGYIKAAEIASAKRLFVEMPARDRVSWSTMITGLAGNGLFGDTFRFFRELLRSGLLPNEASLTGALSSCAQSGAFEFGKVLHGYVEKAGFSPIVSVSNALLDMYSKCGSIAMSQKVFDFMTDRKNIVSWTSIIAALAMHGHGKEALDVFRRMQANGSQPDAITFISVLYACSHAGLIDEGYNYFCSMEEKYGIKPLVEHYGCIVDLYGRAGLLEKAYKFAKDMPMSATAVIWRTLLGACSIHGNIELAEHVNKHLSELEPNNSGDNVLLSNIYAVAGKWSEAANVRCFMSKRRMQKTPGWSSIELDKTMYMFVANDEPNGPKEEAHRKLAEIMLRLRVEGYIPETLSVLYDIEEEEKQDAISRHSEKLAVAFGIARMCPGSQIRVVKNLRVCRDCHTVMKLISKVYETEIVLRDRSRFHLFSKGSCSCGDYW